MIFPRYHQLDAVRRLEAAARDRGRRATTTWSSTRPAAARATPSPGSRTGSPACTTRTTSKVFDSVVVITDRRVLDQQLQDTIYQFEHKQGVVQKIDENSQQLAEALENGVADHHHDAAEVPVRHRRRSAELPERRYAVIVDEAHSSQTGETAKELKDVLAGAHVGRAGRGARRPSEGLERLRGRAHRRRWPRAAGSRTSRFFAFTATPKHKTLEVFGRPGRGRQARALPPLLDAPGDRGGLHPRRARRTTRPTRPTTSCSRPVEDDPDVDRKRKAARGARPLHEPAPAQHRPEDRGDGRALPRRTRATRSAAGPRRWWSPARGCTPSATSRRSTRYIAGEGLHGHQDAGRLLRRRCMDDDAARRQLHRGRHERRHPARRSCPSKFAARRVPGPARRREVPDRLRPAAAAHDVRGQAARRHAGRADALAPEPHRAAARTTPSSSTS